jgi:hypothetical protein
MASKRDSHNGTASNGASNRTLIIIGGHEDKEGKKDILREVARRVRGGKLVVTTVASHEPEGYFESYQKAFDGLGVGQLEELDISQRSEASLDSKVHMLDGAAGLFFTGGDQLKITSQIGDTPISHRIEEIYYSGGLIAGDIGGRFGDVRHHAGARHRARVLQDRRFAHGAGAGPHQECHHRPALRRARTHGPAAGCRGAEPTSTRIGIDETPQLS